MQDVVAQSPSTQAQKLSDADTGEHRGEGGHQTSNENDEQSSMGRQKNVTSVSANNVQPESPISEGQILIHLHVVIVYICNVLLVVFVFCVRLNSSMCTAESQKCRFVYGIRWK